MAGHGEAPARVYPGKSPFAMLPVEECVATVLEKAGGPLEASATPLGAARGLVLASDATARAPVPRFPASIMDGFSVRAADGAGRFPVDEVAGSTAGGASHGPLREGHVRYITTGAPVPEGADAVCKVEDTSEVWQDGRLFIDIKAASKPGLNIRKVGSDTAMGEVVLRRGTLIGAGEVGVLAALGLAAPELHPRPRVAFMSTGDELVDVSEAERRDERLGQIVDCNRPMLAALIEEAGGEPRDLGIVRDEPGLLRAKIEEALRGADVLVSSGGVSRGSRDHVKPLLEELGQVHFGEMCMKPGKPTTFATLPPPAGSPPKRPCLAFALPGNPASCYVTFKLIVAPALERLRGRPAGLPVYPRVDATLARSVEMDPVRPEYHRAVARWEAGRIVASSTGFQRSSRIASVASANCLLEIPRREGVLAAGTVVKALLLPVGAGAGGGISAEGGGYPEAAVEARAPPAEPAPAAAAPAAARPRRVALLAFGAAGAGARAEALEALRAAGVEASNLVERSVGDDAEALRREAGAACGGEAACDLVLVLGGIGMGAAGAAASAALRSLLERDAPGLADAVLRAGLPRSRLVMLEQLLAGVRGRSLLATLPAAAAREGIGALLPLLPARTAALAPAAA